MNPGFPSIDAPRLLAGLAIALLALSACAEGQPPVGAATDVEPRDTSADSASDGESDATEDGTTDDTEGDTGSDTAGDTAGPDAESDISPADATSACEVLHDDCTPFTVTCSADGYSVEVCGRCGEVLRETPCAVNEICDEGDEHAECRECVGDECRPEEGECEPGTVSCESHDLIRRCEDDGTLGATFTCAGGRCVGGACSRTGSDTGATCTANNGSAGTGCKGQLCVCGDEYRSTYGDADCSGMNAVISSGYCSTGSCAENSCNPASEVCADFSLGPAFGGNDFCVTRSSCSSRGQSCGRPGMQCEELPTRADEDEPITWELACWLDAMEPIGAACSSDSECLGGECLRVTVPGGGGVVSYCTQPCGEGAGCPSYAACVERSGSGDFLCMARATERDCPRLSSFDIVERFFPEFGTSDSAAVCFVRGS